MRRTLPARGGAWSTSSLFYKGAKGATLADARWARGGAGRRIVCGMRVALYRLSTI